MLHLNLLGYSSLILPRRFVTSFPGCFPPLLPSPSPGNAHLLSGFYHCTLLGISRIHGFSLDVRVTVQAQTRLLPGTCTSRVASNQEPSWHALHRPLLTPTCNQAQAQLPVSFLQAPLSTLPSISTATFPRLSAPSTCWWPSKQPPSHLRPLQPVFHMHGSQRERFLGHSVTLPILC